MIYTHGGLTGGLGIYLRDGKANFVYVPLAENTTGVCGDDKTTWSIGDGVHPNAGGHARIASVFIPWMRNTLCPNNQVDKSC
jgi:lysophospholipase L1-like esterase